VAKFSGPGWQRLEALGATRQRPLWASTGTKNPHYPDVLYVEELIGPDVINTMPDHTLHAFADHGKIARTIDTDPAAADRTLADAAAAGIDLERVTDELEREGVRSFCDSYHQLLDCIQSKLDTPTGRQPPRPERNQRQAHTPTQRSQPTPSKPRVRAGSELALPGISSITK
jgi:hypothetical protein